MADTNPGEKQSSDPLQQPWRSLLTYSVAIASLAVCVIMAIGPSEIWTPGRRTMIFLLATLLPAILFGDRVSANFKLNLGWTIFTTTGAVAVVAGLLVLLDQLASPEESIAVYYVEDGASELPLSVQSATGKPQEGSVPVRLFFQEENIAVIYPEQVGAIELTVYAVGRKDPFKGKFSYFGSRRNGICAFPPAEGKALGALRLKTGDKCK